MAQRIQYRQHRYKRPPDYLRRYQEQNYDTKLELTPKIPDSLAQAQKLVTSAIVEVETILAVEPEENL